MIFAKMDEFYPLVSIIIATYNSAKILDKPLKAIVKQSYPREALEILIIDGGSSDSTIDIAAHYGCRVLSNPKTDPVNAKIIGMKHAKGQYMITIDHDEVLSNPNSIENRVKALRAHPECKVAFTSGYRCPNGYAGLNEYISEFGDPFSLFYYRFSGSYNHFINSMQHSAQTLSDDANCIVLDFGNNHPRAILELICFGVMIDLNYFKQIFDINRESSAIAHLFHMMLIHGESKVIVSKNDPLDHYSSDSLKKYLPKLKWRIVNNVHYPEHAAQGFNGRVEMSHTSVIRKYLFVPYTISTMCPILDGIYLSLTRHNTAFMLHPILCWYVTCYIGYQYVRKFLALTPALRTYDGKDIARK